MGKWILRGLAFAAAMVVLRLFQGALINAFQTQAGIISLVLLLLFIIAAVIWGAIDGRGDAKNNPDPDYREDLAMVWLLAGLLAGVVSGFVAWLISMFYAGLYVGGFINEVTTFAAFTALVVFLFAIAGVFFARWRVDRKAPPVEHRRGGSEDRGDTDVFDAVHEDETPTGEVPTGRGRNRDDTRAASEQTEERTSSVATAEGERPTEVAPTAHREEPTQAIRTGRGEEDATQSFRTDDRTQAAHTVADADKTQEIRTDSGKTQEIRKPTDDQR